MSNLKTTIYTMIDEIGEAEKITRRLLGQLSRDMLMYVPDSQDIEAVNRLIGKLTPTNAELSVLFFKSFLPWEQEKDAQGKHVRFGKRMKGNKVAVRLLAIRKWLEDEENNIWKWRTENVKEMEVKKKDFSRRLEMAFAAAEAGDKESDTPPLTHAEMATIAMSHLSLEDIMAAVEALEKEEKESESFQTDEEKAQAA